MLAYRELTDKELVPLLIAGDQYAYTEIFNRYKTLLYKHAFKILQDYDEASDIVQELFLALWQKHDQLNPEMQLSSYLYTSVRNRIFDMISHQKVVSRYLESIQEFVRSGHYQTDENVLVKELAAIIEREVAALPPKMREVFELSRREEMSYREISMKLGITQGTVKQQVHNALKILKPKIKTFIFFL